ncbi:AtpZ/AtpI family protein [Anaerobacillus sp. MEB173]|uniref:AtpZ/AtpI family protein n=1 Tax=Anaerobacillus sp. MEB173 TaxID=3383345 RepID=UPI003F905C49
MVHKKPQKQMFRAMAAMSAILSYLVGPVLVGVFGGRWLDQYFGTEPWLLITGIFVGLAAGIYGIVRFIGDYLGDK